MPTKRERDYYAAGFRDGSKEGQKIAFEYADREARELIDPVFGAATLRGEIRRKPKRKLSAWNKYVKANSKKPRFRYRNGKLNLKKMAVAFRKTPAGRKKRR
jgi:hypothetical protein